MGQDRPKITWKEVASKDLQSLQIHVGLPRNRAQWNKKINTSDNN